MKIVQNWQFQRYYITNRLFVCLFYTIEDGGYNVENITLVGQKYLEENYGVRQMKICRHVDPASKAVHK